MRTDIILNQLFEAGAAIPVEELAHLNNISPRTVRNEIRNLNDIGRTNGFKVITKRNTGYLLVVEDYNLFLNYYTPTLSKVDVNNVEQRIIYIQLMLFLADDYLKINDIAERLEISRSTVIKDLERVSKQLEDYGLHLEKKAHYGIKVIGEELNHRKALSKILGISKNQLTRSPSYIEFRNTINLSGLKNELIERIQHYKLNISDMAFKNTLKHIEILAFRISKKNYINKIELNHISYEEYCKSPYFQLSRDICKYLAREHLIEIPEKEVIYLSEHLLANTFADDFDNKQKKEFEYKIVQILKIIDQDFKTSFAEDKELISGLCLHIIPLLRRLDLNMKLENPIIDDVYIRYGYAFNIAIYFVNFLSKNYKLKITKDEIGYIALYFAASLEKQKQNSLMKFKRIAVICSTGGGSAYLIKIKLESIFKDAQIDTASTINLNKVIYGDYDLIITTIPIKLEDITIPVVHITHVLDEWEIKNIDEILSLKYEQSSESSTTYSNDQALVNLFKEDLFIIEHKERNYIDFLEQQCNKLFEKGYALANFPRYVLEREAKMTTIYKNGVAGPHPIKMGAKKDCISVSIFKEPVIYKENQVQIVFLINLKKGHLSLHKEISRMLLQIMNSKRIRNDIIGAKNFLQFIHIIKSL
ncbi:BglG family transcription antiterminator [Caldifermentibacillus hisashii]|uniref:BglG family transcription antiterminator n=1 Tax=Caldifermentibacillus hisashii TaxID=996558 RepID=UPI0031FD290D